MKQLFIAIALALVTNASLSQTVASRSAMTTAELVEGIRQLEVASVADAMEILYGQRNYMVHSMRPLSPSKFAGSAVTVLLKREEHKEGAQASQGMLDAIDNAPVGSVYVMALEDGENFTGIGGIMATTMKVRGLAGAVIDGGGAGRGTDSEAAVSGIQPFDRAFNHYQSFPLRRCQHSGHVRRSAGGSQ